MHMRYMTAGVLIACGGACLPASALGPVASAPPGDVHPMGSAAHMQAALRTRICDPVRTPYPATRYADVALTRIRARGVRCPVARQVARGAHRRALRLGIPDDGVRRFRWRGWDITGDIRPPVDRYVAMRGANRVSWRF